MEIKRGDIYWIELGKYRPAVGHVQKPGRPAIIVSNDANNARSMTFEVVYLTGKPKKPTPTHCAIRSAAIPSTALCEQVTTVSNEQLRDYVGHCTEAELAEIDRCIAISLGLPDPMEDLYEAIREAGTIHPGEEIADPLAKIHDLELQLAEANARAALLKSMYDNLLVLTMRQE